MKDLVNLQTVSDKASTMSSIGDNKEDGTLTAVSSIKDESNNSESSDNISFDLGESKDQFQLSDISTVLEATDSELPKRGDDKAAPATVSTVPDLSVIRNSLTLNSSSPQLFPTQTTSRRNSALAGLSYGSSLQSKIRRNSALPGLSNGSSLQSKIRRNSALPGLSNGSSLPNKIRRNSALPAVTPRPQLTQTGQRRRHSEVLVSSSTLSLNNQKTSRRGSAISIGTKRRLSVKSMDKPPTAPDGGYGWVIVAAAFLMQVVFGGFMFSFGLYFVIFLEVFQEDRAKTAWIGSLLGGASSLAAPIASMLAKSFGCRRVILAGYATLACCIFASTFAPNIYALIVVMGLGSGHITTGGLLVEETNQCRVVGQDFCTVNYRPSVSLPPTFPHTGIGLGLVYLPTIVTVGNYFESKRSLAIAICTAGTGVGGIFFPIIIEKLIELYGWKGSLWVMSGFMVQCFTFTALLRPLTDSDMKFFIRKWQSQRKDFVVYDATPAQCEVNLGFQADFSNDMDSNISTMDEIYINDLSIMAHQDSDDGSDFEKTSNHFEDTESLSNSDVESNKPEPDRCSCIRKGWEAFSSYTDVWLLENPIFLLYTTAFILAMVGVRVSSTFLADLATGLRVPLDKVSILLSITGIFNTLSKILAGYVSDKPWVDPLVLYSGILIAGGIVMVGVPFMTMYSHLIAFTVVSGSNIGAISLLNSVNMVDLLGMNKMSGGLGLIMMLGGLAALLSVPFAGWLYDVTGTYHATYYMSGGCAIAAGLLCLPLRTIARCIYGKDSEPDLI